jgi:hypothetical protein
MDGRTEDFGILATLLLESIDKLSRQTEALEKQYAALDKGISLLKQSYEAKRIADREGMSRLMAEVQRIAEIVEQLRCGEHREKLWDFQDRIALLENGITPSRWVKQVLGVFFQQAGWIFGALIVGGLGYVVYAVAIRMLLDWWRKG